jgi:hypothetical protein
MNKYLFLQGFIRLFFKPDKRNRYAYKSNSYKFNKCRFVTKTKAIKRYYIDNKK